MLWPWIQCDNKAHYLEIKLELLGLKTECGLGPEGHHQMPRASVGGSCMERPLEGMPGLVAMGRGSANLPGCWSSLPTWWGGRG